MKRIFALLVCLVFLSTFFPNYVSAITITKGVIDGDDVALRSSASTDSKIIQRLPKGTVVEIKKTNVNAQWHQVSYNGKNGYVNRVYINWDSSLDQYNSSYTGTVINCAQDVNVRSSPNTRSNVLGAAKKGAKLKVTDTTPAQDWTEVEFDGKKGYINNKFLSVSAKASDDELTSLSVSNGGLNPFFSPKEHGYFVTASKDKTIIRCNANSGVSVTMNDEDTKEITLNTTLGTMRTVRIALNGKVNYTVYVVRNVLVLGTWNIKQGNGGKLPEQGRLVRNEMMDILGVQEARYNFSGNIVNNLLSLKTKEMQNTQHAVAFKIGSDGGFGNGIISRYKFLSTKQFSLPSGDLEKRTLQKVEVNIAGRRVSIYNTHLSWQSASVRKPQFAEIAKIMADDPNKYKILMGDFNAHFSEFSQLGNKYVAINTPTTKYLDYYGNRIKKNEIDNIFVTKNIKVLNTRMVKTSYSDHNPVIAYLSFQ